MTTGFRATREEPGLPSQRPQRITYLRNICALELFPAAVVVTAALAVCGGCHADLAIESHSDDQHPQLIGSEGETLP